MIRRPMYLRDLELITGNNSPVSKAEKEGRMDQTV